MKRIFIIDASSGIGLAIAAHKKWSQCTRKARRHCLGRGHEHGARDDRAVRLGLK